MSENKIENRHIILASTCVFVGIFYFIQSRNRRRHNVGLVDPKLITEKYHNTSVNQVSSWFRRNFSFVNKHGISTQSDNHDDITNNNDLQHHHPEGPNIGFESDESWYKNTTSPSANSSSSSLMSPAKVDLLHQGHTKGGKLVIVMVGLPGRGKTYIARKIARYLRWIAYRTRAFSLAKYRLDQMGSKTAEFFDPTSSSNYQTRNSLIMEALEDTCRYLARGGEIAIIDGTNTTKDRRQLIHDRIARENGYQILWIESIYKESSHAHNTPVVVSTTPAPSMAAVTGDNVDSATTTTNDDATAPTTSSRRRYSLNANNTSSENELISELISEATLKDLQQNSPDFVDKEDYMKRLALYKQHYETLEPSEGSYVKYYDNGSEIVLHEIYGYLRTKIVSYLMNLHTSPRPIYMVRHGQSNFNVRNLIGGDSSLSPLGLEFSRALNEYLHHEELSVEDFTNLTVWTSNMKRAKQTGAEIASKKSVEWRALREIEVGICDGLSYDQVKTQLPEEYRSRQQDKLKYRYPRGESYLDVITRLEPVLFELERQREPLIIIAHQAVLRCLYAYFLDLPAEEIPFLSIPLHTLIKLEVNAYGCREKRVRIVTPSNQGGDVGSGNSAEDEMLMLNDTSSHSYQDILSPTTAATSKHSSSLSSSSSSTSGGVRSPYYTKKDSMGSFLPN